ncbi:hypothetical protein VaNZ11_007091 [Volvox africanus]|uniref:Protein kinase domain-containing protein n=1 Tax=Volvox africanus TaxID=51714 RepID=A0ABQ5S3B5_9CHLO|nr:hypothetical protein VaNZ11_007091 [Volvox africanus]
MVTCTFAWCFPSIFRTRASGFNTSSFAEPQPAMEADIGQPKERICPGASRAAGQHIEILEDGVMFSNNLDVDERNPGETPVTQPLPMVTEPKRVLLRSISISGDTRECSFTYTTAIMDAALVAGAQPTPLEAREVLNEHATHHNADETQPVLRTYSTINMPSRSASMQALGALGTNAVHDDLGMSIFASPGQAALLEAAKSLEGVTTTDFTVDFIVTGATARLWPNGQGGSDPSVPVSTSPGATTCVNGLEAGQPSAVETAHGSLTYSIAAAAGPGATAETGGSANGIESSAAAVSGEAISMPAGPTAQSLLNLSQVRDCVQGLSVLHIRPGAALLMGESITSGQSVVARFELGWPASLLAPQLLTTLQEGRCWRHPHVVTLLGVHAIALPAQVLKPPLPGLSLLAPSPLHGNSSGGGASAPSADVQWESLDKDLATATRALKQAEIVRGANNNGSGPIGSTEASSDSNPTTGDCGGPLKRVLGSPHVRLRGEVGHLRGTGGHGGSCAAESASHCKQPALTLPPQLWSPPPPPRANPLLHPACTADVAFVTLSIMEVCGDGNLGDEIRRGAFRCCLPEPPASDANTRHRQDLRYFTETQFLSRLDRFVDMARQIALGLQFLHTTCRLAHGDLVSRNVLLQRRLVGEPWVNGATSFMVKLAGYGRLATAAAAIAMATATATPASSSGGEAVPSAANDATARVSTTSLSRINSVHIGLWRDVYSLAPERLRDLQAPPTFEADVYAYGTILYEMAVGESPWASMLPACVAVGVATGELRIHWNHSETEPKCKAGSGSGTYAPLPCIAALVERCTSPLPEDRPSVAQILDALEAIGEEVRTGREIAESLRQQRSSERLMKTFLSSSSSFGSRTCAGGSLSGGSSWIEGASL